MTKRNLPFLMVVAALSAVLAFTAIGCGGDDEENTTGCQTSSDCADGQACYNNVCATICQSNAECTSPLVCDPVFRVCIPDATADGDVDLDQTCTVGQNQCIGTTVYTCVNAAWTAGVNCADNGMTCQNGVCVPATTDGDTDVVENTEDVDTIDNVDTVDEDTAACTTGEKKCIGDMSYTCNSGNWSFTADCAQQGKTCDTNTGECTGGSTTTELCPTGQTCAAITDSGVMGCLEGQDLPANSQTGCGQDSPCTQNGGNASCFCQDANCTSTVCISNCGSCPSGQTCTAITDSGAKGCLEGQDLPANSQTGCGQDSPCTQNGGNASCFCQDANCTSTVCISNCSADGGGTVDPPTGEGCPTGQTCTAITDSGAKGCLEGQDLPANSQTGCGQDSPCTQNGGNASCFCQDANCTSTVCISNCGACPTGQSCTAITDSGAKGCLEGQDLPANSQTGCGQDSPCTQNGGNASCFCQDANCTSTVCISNCGV